MLMMRHESCHAYSCTKPCLLHLRAGFTNGSMCIYVYLLASHVYLYASHVYLCVSICLTCGSTYINVYLCISMCPTSVSICITCASLCIYASDMWIYTPHMCICVPHICMYVCLECASRLPVDGTLDCSLTHSLVLTLFSLSHTQHRPFVISSWRQYDS